MSEPVNYFANDAFARHIGIELIETTPGIARAKMPIRDFHLNGLGLVQGGAIFSLAVWTFAIAANSHGHKAVGLNAAISFTQAARDGTLYAHAKEISRNQRIATYDVIVRDDHNTVIANFQGMAYLANKKNNH